VGTTSTSTPPCWSPTPRRSAPPATTRAGFGFHPLLCYLAETGEPLAAILRPGNAAAHTAADHSEVLQLALEQLPAQDLEREILARADIGGRTHAFTSDCRSAGIRFSVR
jgi:Transposase DDE domain group 1